MKFGTKWQARVYDAGTAEGWKSQIATSWKENKPADFVQFTGPVGLFITFLIPRPKSHFLRSGLRETAPFYCMKKPDVDNYAKAVMDALTVLGVFVDDSLVCDLRVIKRFVPHGAMAPWAMGAQIELKELEQ